MSETDCELVSSRGILKSCQYHHPNPSSSSHTVSYGLNQVTMFHSPNSKVLVIYVCSSAINDFVQNYLPNIRSHFKLVTGDSDTTIPYDCEQAASVLLASPFLIKWYSQNCTGKHPKLQQIPIGLDYHTMSYGQTSWGAQLSPYAQETLLKSLNVKPFWERLPKCYGNFHFAMTHRYAQIDRVDARTHIPAGSIDYQESHVERKKTWEKMSQYAFIPSPHGNGLDCHRTWEAIALGCIPIVRTSQLDTLYDELPVWIVKDWDEITPEAMKTTIEKFKVIKFNMEKMTLTYWMNIINNGK